MTTTASSDSVSAEGTPARGRPALAANVTRERPAPKVHEGQARMFRSDFFEFFSHVHPATPAVVYLPLVAYALYQAAAVAVLGPFAIAWRFLVGYLVWTVFEYWLHKLVFHVKVVGPKTQRLYFLIHGVHHDYPWDRTRLVIPLAASVALGVLFWFVFGFVFDSLLADSMYPWYAGFVGGYILYDTIHWYVHARNPKTRFGRWLRREHMIHHFRAPESRFGVSCPWMDHLFGTTGKDETDGAPIAAAGH